jgi:carbamoyltransferase
VNVLGLSCFYHDAAAALLRDGVIVAAAQEERFSRKKHDASLPRRAIAYVLAEAGLSPGELDAVAFYEKPFLKLERLLTSHVAGFPRSLRAFGAAMPSWLGEKLWARALLRDALAPYRGPLYFAEHHESHAASAFYASGFDEAAVLTVDGVGEWATTTLGVGRGARLELEHELCFPHSVGLLYSAFTAYLGFRVLGGEYKVMGLAPYGTPRHTETILRELVRLTDDGGFELDLRYFDFAFGLSMTTDAFHERFGGPPRPLGAEPGPRERDLAASVQRACEELLLRLVRRAHESTGLDALCLAGGVAENSVANGRIAREGPFSRLFVPPAPGDAGGAVGAAYVVHHLLAEGAPRGPAWTSAALGPSFDEASIAAALAAEGARFERHDEASLALRVARGARRGARGGAVGAGPHGARPARAGAALHPRRRAARLDARAAQRAREAARGLPPVRARGARRARERVARARRREPVHVARGAHAPRQARAAGP